MAVARNQITITSVQRDYTFLRYSNDGGKTFTPAKPWVETGEYGNGRNLLNGIPTEVSFSTQKDFTVGPIGKVLVGSMYAVSFDVENSEAQNAVGDVLFWSQTYKSVIIVHFVADNTKRHVEFSFVMPNWVENGGNSGFRVRFRKTSGSGTVTVSKAKLEIGDTATDWSPSPEDQQLGTTPGKYLGTLVWDKPYPSMDTSAYTWSEVQGIQGERGEKGEAAEVYRLDVVEETAKVNPAGVLYVSLSYSVLHIHGSKVENVGNLDDFRVVCESDTHDGATVEKGFGFVCKYTMNDYLANSNRPSFFRVRLFRGNELLDERVVNVQLEAASYVEVVGDLRKTVSQNGRNISRIEQKADGISLKVEGMKNGVRNLLKGGRLNVSFSTYGLPSAFRLKLKPDTDYTLTVCGRISEDALKKGQTLRTYVFDVDWKWSADFGIQSTSDTAASVTFRIPADRHSPEDYIISSFPFPDQEPNGKNGEVTVSWIVLTEGTQAAASWIPAEGETGEEKAREVEARLENGEFRVKSDRTVFVDGNGKETVLIKDGKLSAELIDAVKLVAAGIRAQTIDAQNAVFRNLTVEGDSTFRGRLDGTSGTFKSLDCIDGKGETVGGIGFSQNGRMYFSGHVSMNGTKKVNGRPVPFRFYTSDVWCRGQFGNLARTFAVIKDEFMYVHHGGHEDTDGVKIRMDTATYAAGGYPAATAYVIPLYSPGYNGAFGRWHGTVVDIDNPNVSGGDPSEPSELAADPEIPVGCPIDVVIFNCTKDAYYTFYGMLDGKTWTVINGGKYRNTRVIDRGGVWDMPGGTTAEYTYVSPKWLTPRYDDDGNSPWLGVMRSGSEQINL